MYVWVYLYLLGSVSKLLNSVSAPRGLPRVGGTDGGTWSWTKHHVLDRVASSAQRQLANTRRARAAQLSQLIAAETTVAIDGSSQIHTPLKIHGFLLFFQSKVPRQTSSFSFLVQFAVTGSS
jgi:hypothetical protein